jgi:hypothetical protein
MSKFGDSVRLYFSTTRSLLYSYLVSLPLLLLYEALIYLAQPDASHVVRISVDVWIKTLFHYIGQDILSITLIFVALIGVFIIYRERSRLSSLKFSYFITMIIEASFYAFVLALLITLTVNSLLQAIQASPVETLSLLQKMALSMGAGLYEELFFRVILVSILLFIFRKIFSVQLIAYVLAMLLAATIFSFAHYVGELGDPFTLGSFLFRFLFGLALNAIYIWRGFGTAAWTHAIYDLMVIVY